MHAQTRRMRGPPAESRVCLVGGNTFADISVLRHAVEVVIRLDIHESVVYGTYVFPVQENGRFVSFSPCVEQVQRVCEVLHARKFRGKFVVASWQR